MLSTVKVASLKVIGDRRSEVEAKVGKKIMQLCNKHLFDATKGLACSVHWQEDEEVASFCAVITIFYQYDDADVERRHCEICKETHDLFYCNREYNCRQCAFAAYKYRREERVKEMRRAGRYVLNRDN